MRRLALAAMLLVIGAVAGATHGEAAGSSTWILQATPTPNVTTGGGLLVGVSCPSTTDCVAVGYDGAAPLSEMWNGSKWTVHPVSVPAGSLRTQLQGVSCPSTTTVGCTAVGSYLSTAGSVTLAERWSKGHWVIQPTPTSVTGASGPVLFGIDCLVASNCTAVGRSGVNETLVEQWNGVSWALVTSPIPSGSSWSQLNGVSCSSRTACVAVGYALDSSGNEFMLAEGWDGGQWTILAPPEPDGATQSSLASVSCAPAAGCVAVGIATIAGADIESLAEGWDGSQWTIEPTPSLSTPELNGVSCPAPGNCTAVGSYDTSGSTGFPLAEAWNGTVWTVESTQNPSGRTLAWLRSASCVSTTTCEAVGFSRDKPGHFHTLAESATP
jgi:hypothetical protein